MKASRFCDRCAWILTSLVFSLLLLESAGLAGPPPYSTNHPVGPSARAVARGDFTGDGWLDIAVACNDRTKPEVSLLVGTGEGRFAASFPCVQWGVPFDVAAGDFDEDGKLDLAVSSDHSMAPAGTIPRAVRVFFGDGRGNFPQSTDPFDLPGANDPNKYPTYPYLVAADVTLEGHLDLVAFARTLGGSRNPILTLAGNGRGSFTAKVSEISDASSVYGLAAGDLDEDGRLDLAILRSATGDGAVQIALGRTDGTFAESPYAVAPGGNSPAQGLWIADLDVDGHLDLVCALPYSDRLAIHYGKGQGKFEVPAWVDTPRYPRWVQAGDFNDDGHLDLYTCAEAVAPSAGAFFPGLGARGFGPAGYYTSHGAILDGITADVSGDGIQDLVTVCEGSRVAVSLGGMPCGPAGERYIQAEDMPRHAAVLDMNGDGRQDLVVLSNATAAPDTITVMTARSDGTLRAEAPVEIPGDQPDPYSALCADVDADRLPDAVVSDIKLGVHVLLGDGHGHLTHAGTFGAGIKATCAAIGNLNADLHPDLVVSGSTSTSFHVLLGDGTGGLGAPVAFEVTQPGSYLPGYISLADLDGDGNLDSLLSVRGNRPVAIFPGDGQGGFEAKRMIPGLPLAQSSQGGNVAAADLDGDRVLDVVELDRSAKRVHVWRGLGGWTFGDPSEFLAGNAPAGLVVEDLDQDGDIDIATGVSDPDPGASGRPAVVVHRNSGGGTFAVMDKDYVDLLWSPADVLAGDLDGNGALELVGYHYQDFYTFLSAASLGSVGISRVDPSVGPRAGGTKVAIQGRGLAEGMKISFGNAVPSDVKVLDSRTIEAVTPPSATEGYVAVRVGPKSLPNGFRYRDRRGISRAFPDWAPLAGGTTVEILGEGFSTAGTVTVFLGKLKALVDSASASKIVIRTPAASREEAVSILVRDAAGELVLPKGFFFGEKKAPAVGTVAIIPVDGGRKLTWSNTGDYDSIVITRSDGQQIVLDGSATEYLDTSSGATISSSYTVTGQVAGLADSGVVVINPAETTCPWRYSTGNSKVASEKWVPLRPGIVYGTKISIPALDEGGRPFNRFILSALVRRDALWGELVATVHEVVEPDELENNTFPVVASGIILPVPGVPSGFGWVERTVELTQEAQSPCNDGLWNILTNKDYFVCLSTRLRQGEEAHEGDRVAPFSLLTAAPADPPADASIYRSTYEVYIENAQCGVPFNVLAPTDCHAAEIVPVRAPDPMIRILPLPVSEPRLRIERIDPLLIGVGGEGGSESGTLTYEFAPVLVRDLSAELFGGPWYPDVTEWSWNFGDGIQQATAGGSIVHSYEDGVFKLTVSARAASCERSLPFSYTLKIDTSRPGDQIIVTEMGAIEGEFRDALIVGTEVQTDGGPCSGPGPFNPLVYLTTRTGGGQIVDSVTFEVDIDGDGQSEDSVDGEIWRGEATSECTWQARLVPSLWSWPASLTGANEIVGKVSSRAQVGGEDNPPQPDPVVRDVVFRLPPMIVRDDWADSRKALRENPESWVDEKREYHFKVRYPNLIDWSEPLDLWVVELDNVAKAYADFELHRGRALGTQYVWQAKAEALCQLTLLEHDVIKEGLSRNWTFPDATATGECNALADDLGKPRGSILCLPLGPKTLFSSGKITLVPEIEVPVYSIGIADLTLRGSVFAGVCVGGNLLIAFDASEADLNFGSIEGFKAGITPWAELGARIMGCIDALVLEVSAGIQVTGGLGLPIEFVAGFDGEPFPTPQTFRVSACWSLDFDLVGEVCVGIWPFKKCWSGSADLYSFGSCTPAERCDPYGKTGEGGGRGGILSGPVAAAGGGRVVQVFVRDVGSAQGEIVSELYWSSRPDDGEYGPEAPFFAGGSGHPKLNPAVAWVAGPGGAAGRVIAAWTEIPLEPSALGNFQDAGDSEAILAAQEIFVSSLDLAANVWSPPARLTNDPVPDGMPTVCAGEEPGKARIAWVGVPSTGGPILHSDSAIRNCVVDAATLQVVGGIAELGAGNGKVDRMPLLVSGPDTAALCWVSDEDRDLRTKVDRWVHTAFPQEGILVAAANAAQNIPGLDRVRSAMFGQDADGDDVLVSEFEKAPVLDGVKALRDFSLDTLLHICPLDSRAPCVPYSGPEIGMFEPGPDMDWIHGWFVSRNRVSADEVMGWLDDIGGLTRIDGVQGGQAPLEGGSPWIVQVDRGQVIMAFNYDGLAASHYLDGQVALATVDAATGKCVGPVTVLTSGGLPQKNMSAVMDGLGNVDILLSRDVAGMGGSEGRGADAPRNVLRPFLGQDLAVELRASDACPDPGRLVDLEVTLRSLGVEPVPEGSFSAILEREMAGGFWAPIGELVLSGSFAPGSPSVGGALSYRPAGGRERIRASVGDVPGERTASNNSAEISIGLEAPQEVSCVQVLGSMTPEVEIRWKVDMPGASVRILRDGEGVAVVPGESEWWIDAGARPGEHAWTVIAEYQGCLSPRSSCSLEVSEVRLLLRAESFQLRNDGVGVETLVRADLEPDVDLRGFSLGVAHEAPLVLLAADAAETFSAEAEFVDVQMVDGGAVAKVDFGEDPSKWVEGSNLPVLRLVYAVPAGPGVLPEGSAVATRKIELRDDLGAPVVPVRLLGPTGEWEPAARESAVATIHNAETGTRFVRGDANADGFRNITDGIFILNLLFLGGAEPPCRESADTNGDASLNITDGIYILNFLFLGGPAPPAPYPNCGSIARPLNCASFPPCEP